MKQIQVGNGGGKIWAKSINKKGQANKSQNSHQIDKMENGNVDTNSNNGVNLVDNRWMCLCNRCCGFNSSHTTGFHDTWAACV